jgi:hypothetical protein
MHSFVLLVGRFASPVLALPRPVKARGGARAGRGPVRAHRLAGLLPARRRVGAFDRYRALGSARGDCFGAADLYRLGARVFCSSGAAQLRAHFVLISTDKAVRSTHIKGATKRLAEMVLQGAASAVSRS